MRLLILAVLLIFSYKSYAYQNEADKVLVLQCERAGWLAAMIVQNAPGLDEKSAAARWDMYQKINDPWKPTPRQMERAIASVLLLQKRASENDFKTNQRLGSWSNSIEASNAASFCLYFGLKENGRLKP